MRNIKEVQRDIERCQKQIANTYDLNLNFENESDRRITREGFQLQLAKLFRERALHDGGTNFPIIISNRREKSQVDSPTSIQRRSLEACRLTIQQAKELRNK